MWRPILAKVVTYTELATIMSFADLVEINAILDAKDELESREQKEMKNEY